MTGDTVIVDAVVHPWNMSPENQNPDAQAQIDAVYASHRLSYDAAHADYIMQPEEFFRDPSFETIARAEFVESPVDFAILHALPNLGFGLGPITLTEKCAEFRDCYPDRVRIYGTVGTPITTAAIEDITRQVGEFGINGVKLYPAFFYDGKGEGWRMDGEDWATPFFEAVRKLGLSHIAIHKALWLEPAPKSAFDIDDLASPLDRFPDMTFEMVHGGAAFLDETIRLMQRYRNLYLTLETTFSYILTRPRVFAKILGRLITEVGSNRLLFASGNNLAHPRPLIEAFDDYQFAEEDRHEFGIRSVTDEDRRNIMGLNALRLHGLDAAAVIAGTHDDCFARARQIAVPGPWSDLRP